MDDREIGIVLRRTLRSDGSVMVDSGDLPMFFVVGNDKDHAVSVALDLLPEYLHANFPEFVEFRTVDSLRATFEKSEDQQLAPVCLIARGAGKGASTNSQDCR